MSVKTLARQKCRYFTNCDRFDDKCRYIRIFVEDDRSEYNYIPSYGDGKSFSRQDISEKFKIRKVVFDTLLLRNMWIEIEDIELFNKNYDEADRRGLISCITNKELARNRFIDWEKYNKQST
jgi:hypothetical protein